MLPVGLGDVGVGLPGGQREDVADAAAGGAFVVGELVPDDLGGDGGAAADEFGAAAGEDVRAGGGEVDVCWPSVTPSVEPLSPAATVMVTPRAAADWQAASSAVMACAVQLDSGPPQLMEMTLGLLVVSWTAVVMASMKPWSVLGVK